jgi:hypothetical protein
MHSPIAGLGRRVVSDTLWAIWDNLFGFVGTAVLVGLAGALVVGIAISLLPLMPPGLPLLAATVGIAFILNLVQFWAWSGFRSYASRAISGGTARWPDFLSGIQSPLWSIRCGLVVFVALLLLIANLIFYASLSGQSSIGLSLQMAAATVGMLVFWVFVIVGLFLWAGMSDPAPEPPTGPLSALRRGYALVLVAPRAWLGGLVLLVSLSVLFLIGMLTVIFIPPLAAFVGAAAGQAGERHHQFLLQAREALGPEAALGELQKKAAEYWEAHDARQPRRTLRQVLRPWEE